MWKMETWTETKPHSLHFALHRCNRFNRNTNKILALRYSCSCSKPFDFDRKILRRTDYVLLLTFFCFFVFSSSICRNPSISDFLKKSVEGNEYWWSILLSQIISNVPASIVLWPFTTNLKALLYGLDSAGLCSIIGSLASVINYRIYSKEYPGNAAAFMKTFQIISLAFFAIVVIPQWFLCR